MVSVIKKKRGFALLDAQARHAIAVMGGKAQPAAKRAFAMNRQLAREAGRKGGVAVAAARELRELGRDLVVLTDETPPDKH